MRVTLLLVGRYFRRNCNSYLIGEANPFLAWWRDATSRCNKNAPFLHTGGGCVQVGCMQGRFVTSASASGGPSVVPCIVRQFPGRF